MEYLNTSEIAKLWGISDRRVRVLCEQGKIAGVERRGRAYLIPANAIKPADGRKLRYYEIAEQSISLVSRIDALAEQLNQCRPFTAGELKRLQETFLIEYTYNSNAIEGSTLTLQETALVLEGLTIYQKPLKHHLEAVGHRDAFLFVQQLVSDKVRMSESLIKQIHALVLMDSPEDRGIYRRVAVRISGAHHEPTQPLHIAEQMEALVAEFRNLRLHPIEAAALFHLKFEGIHPFIDGNGRTGRLIMNFTLMQHGYPPIDVKFTDRKRYYDSFDQYFRYTDSSAMVRLVAGYVEERLAVYTGILSPSL